MFEKEAEIYALSNYGFRGKNSQRVLTAKIDWQKGAEFGFQKGIKAKINTTTISDCPIKDEWHYVKDGDLPTEELRQRTRGYYLTASKYVWNKWLVFEVAYFTGNIFTKGGDILDSVIAWKEIVPPKESL